MTLCYGDPQPTTDMGRLLAIAETFHGALLLTPLVCVRARRATR